MKLDTDISILVNNHDIQNLINGLTNIQFKKGITSMVPYGHPDKKTGRSYKYTKSGYELPEYILDAENGMRIIFRNVEG